VNISVKAIRKLINIDDIPADARTAKARLLLAAEYGYQRFTYYKQGHVVYARDRFKDPGLHDLACNAVGAIAREDYVKAINYVKRWILDRDKISGGENSLTKAEAGILACMYALITGPVQLHLPKTKEIDVLPFRLDCTLQEAGLCGGALNKLIRITGGEVTTTGALAKVTEKELWRLASLNGAEGILKRGLIRTLEQDMRACGYKWPAED